MYRKVPKFSDTINLCCNQLKIHANRPNHRVFCPNDANGIQNSEDPDQTAPLSALFAQTYLFENLGSLRYLQHVTVTLGKKYHDTFCRLFTHSPIMHSPVSIRTIFLEIR